MTQPRSDSFAVWVDFGGVLTPPALETFTALCTRTGVAPEAMLGAMVAVAADYGTTDIMEPLDTPLVDADAWSAQVQQHLADDHGVTADLCDFTALWFADRPPNRALVSYLTTLRARGHVVGMLSNMVPSFEPYWRTMVDPALFDDLVMSYQVGTRKPHRAIYELAQNRCGVPPERCVLLDDLPENCAGAEAAGWHAIHHERTVTTITRLDALLHRSTAPSSSSARPITHPSNGSTA